MEQQSTISPALQPCVSPVYLDKRAVAATLQVSERTVDNHVRAGLLPPPAKTPGRKVLWLVADLEAAMPGAWAQLGAAASVRGAVTMPTSPANRGRTPGSCTKPPTTVDSPVISVPTGIPAATAANTHTRSALRRLLENRKSEAASAVSALRAQEHLEISRPMATVQLNELQCKLEALVNELRDNYVPGHGPRQFICPSVFLKSELFRADASAGPRENIDCQLHTGTADPVRYVGPELRQDDALVFMAMVHMGRDFPPATTLTFSATEMCLCLFGGYDGSRRRRLADCIKRLMRGVRIPVHAIIESDIRSILPDVREQQHHRRWIDVAALFNGASVREAC